MSLVYIQKFPSVEDILSEQPVPEKLKKIKAKRDNEIAKVFIGKSNKLILIIGPCSAHNEDAVCDYVSRLAKIQDKVKSKIIIIPRIYTNKPRTTGVGYKGMLHQPNLNEKPNMAKGLQAIRHMHIRALSESHLPSADEMLYPGNYPYLADILSYVAIGARSVENQQHRLTVSGLDIPVGMKNPTSGDIKVMIDSVYAAQNSHTFIYNNWEVFTEGNGLAHSIVRGSVDHTGKHYPNYHYEDLEKLSIMLNERKLNNPSIIIDTNHSNSGKQYKEQPRIAKEVIHSMKNSSLIHNNVKGFMIESYLLEGSQDMSNMEYGKSVTDPCLGWEDSERLIYELAELL
jgi:3-deoxy-7-phosphoheptulonate synthase